MDGQHGGAVVIGDEDVEVAIVIEIGVSSSACDEGF